MYAWLVERRVRAVFAALGRRDLQEVLPGLAPDVHHRFAGRHALGGERHDREAVELWFRRLFRLYDGLDFTVHRVVVGGPPWDLVVTVEWTVWATPCAGPSYENAGCHVLRIRWGKVACLHAYEDSQAVVAALEAMVAAGHEEAGADHVLSTADGAHAR